MFSKLPSKLLDSGGGVWLHSGFVEARLVPLRYVSGLVDLTVDLGRVCWRSAGLTRAL